MEIARGDTADHSPAPEQEGRRRAAFDPGPEFHSGHRSRRRWEPLHPVEDLFELDVRGETGAPVRRRERVAGARVRAQRPRVRRGRKRRLARLLARLRLGRAPHKRRRRQSPRLGQATASTAPAAPRPAPRPSPRAPRKRATHLRAPRISSAPRKQGAVARPAPRARKRAGLLKPTAKAGLALVLASGAAAALGAAAGLPIPVLDRQGASPLNAATLEPPILLGGTAPGTAPGRVHPVVAPHTYGESEARFGDDRGGRMHEGQDVFAKPGTPLVALRDGVVLDTGGDRALYPGGGGNYVVFYSPMDDRSYVYLHMLKPPLVQEGQRVRAGQVLGQVGCTGFCEGPHLHLEIRLGRADWGVETKPVDPMPLLKNLPPAKPAPRSPRPARASGKKAGAGA